MIIKLHNLLSSCKIKYNKNNIKNVNIVGASDILRAKKNYISFFSNTKYLNSLKKTKASVILISIKFLKFLPQDVIPVIVDFPDLEFIKILNYFYPDKYFSKIDQKVLEPDLILKKYKNITFGNNFNVEENVKIGKNVFIGHNVTIKKNSNIGNNVIVGSNVIIESSDIFDNVHICDGAIIGKKGFGFKFINNKCFRIPHIGRVVIEEGCEIGSYTIIDRGSVNNTTIGKDTFLDNFVHIAHNVTIGKKCILAAQVGVAGSTKIGNNVVVGGQTGISGHLVIGDNVKIGGKSGVIKNIRDNEVVMGYPSVPFREFVKNNK